MVFEEFISVKEHQICKALLILSKDFLSKISLPLWMTKRLVDQIGYEETEKLGLSLYQPSHASARVDTRRLSRDQAITVLQEEEDHS
ncbi:Ribosomal RNA small subunit methyltransferase B [Enterococcus faecium]|uniref:hypothetical protein n=1 Tax=Enterococcus faecium TaxID=1352 RepID=UPI0010255465|nr:hypothetical protein [Enterococcus faecium]VFA75508.1 Ribosomal RNA small subunit methyltransferase B [Enterococcus faecium]